MNPTARRSAIGWPLVCVLLLGAAQAVSALDLESILAQSRYSTSEKQAFETIFAQADQARIPQDLLLPRLAEGVAKGVRFQLIADVLNNSLRSLERARSILESSSEGKALLADPASWSLSATLLETGASEQEIKMLEDAAQGKSAAYRMAGFLHAALVNWGLSRQMSLQVALSALHSAVPPEQFVGVIDLFEEGRQKRIPPDRMAGRVIETLPAAKSMDDLRRAVLY